MGDGHPTLGRRHKLTSQGVVVTKDLPRLLFADGLLVQEGAQLGGHDVNFDLRFLKLRQKVHHALDVVAMPDAPLLLLFSESFTVVDTPSVLELRPQFLTERLLPQDDLE